MLLAILSDSHDQIIHLRRAAEFAETSGAQALIHCGDLISPFMLQHLSLFTGEIHLIYGNNGGDHHLISSRCTTSSGKIHHHGVFGALELGGVHLAFHHYPDIAKGLAASGQYDVVCCGHNHRCEIQWINNCLLVNPGDLLGKDTPPGFLLLDTETLVADHVVVGDPINFDSLFTPLSTTLNDHVSQLTGNLRKAP